MDSIIDQTGTVLLFVALLYAASFIIQLFYYLFFFLRFIFRNNNVAISVSGEPVSVIICARNEAENLKNNLPLVLAQDYDNYEVIVVNDSSEDNTEEILEDLKGKYRNLRTTRIKKDLKFRHGKKLALTIGLKAARTDWVLLTDADCKPASPLWISQMQKHFSPSCEIILGYGAYQKRPGLLNMLARFDTFFIAIQYFSLALAGYPYMGVGRNLAYKRQLFFANKGFASHLKLESGDDDLFVNENATGDNTAVEFSHYAHTYSFSPESWSAWVRQKRRHLTTGFHYRRSTRFILGLEISSRLVYYLSFAILLAGGFLIPYIVSIFGLRLIINSIILKLGMKRLNEKNLLLISPIFDLFILFFNIFCMASNFIIQKRSRWR